MLYMYVSRNRFSCVPSTDLEPLIGVKLLVRDYRLAGSSWHQQHCMEPSPVLYKYNTNSVSQTTNGAHLACVLNPRPLQSIVSNGVLGVFAVTLLEIILHGS